LPSVINGERRAAAQPLAPFRAQQVVVRRDLAAWNAHTCADEYFIDVFLDAPGIYFAKHIN